MNEWLNQSINQSVRRSCSKSYPGYISVNWTLNMHQKLVFGRTHLLSMSSEPSSKFLICSAADYVLAPHSQPLDVFYNSRFHGMLHSICLMLLFFMAKVHWMLLREGVVYFRVSITWSNGRRRRTAKDSDSEHCVRRRSTTLAVRVRLTITWWIVVDSQKQLVKSQSWLRGYLLNWCHYLCYRYCRGIRSAAVDASDITKTQSQASVMDTEDW